MNCPRNECKNKAIIDRTIGILPCRSCQKKDGEITVRKSPEFYSLSKQDRVQEQRDKFAKDILQPWDGNKPNESFLKAYPEYRNDYYTKEDLKKI